MRYGKILCQHVILVTWLNEFKALFLYLIAHRNTKILLLPRTICMYDNNCREMSQNRIVREE